MCYNKRVRLKKRLPARVKEPLIIPEVPNRTWSMDFVSDTLNSGRKFRVLNILDDFNERGCSSRDIDVDAGRTSNKDFREGNLE